MLTFPIEGNFILLSNFNYEDERGNYNMSDKYLKTCKTCDKDFYVDVSEMSYPGGKDMEFIYCPYCRAVNGYVMTDGFVSTTTVEEEEKLRR